MRTVLALTGGEPVRRDPVGGWPQFGARDIGAVADVLASGRVNYWTGPQGRHFETEFADFVDRPHAVAVTNGTAALELALHALGIGPGDEVIVPSRTFIATASAVVMRGARPVVVDVDPVSQNLTPDTAASGVSARTKAVIAVHLAGWPCEMDEILEFARAHDLKVVEDCAQAQGGRYRGRPIGSFGDAAAFSFCQDKIMTTGGEGGMLVLSDDHRWRRAWAFKDHGKDYGAVHQEPFGAGFRWVHESFGTNLRMTELQAALGRAALAAVPEWVERRRRNAGTLRDCFQEIPALRVPEPPEHCYHAYYKFYAFVRPELLRTGWTRDLVLDAIRAEGVPCFSGTCSEIYLEKAFPDDLRPSCRFPTARELGETSLMFLVHPTLSVRDVEDTCAAVRKVMRVAAWS